MGKPMTGVGNGIRVNADELRRYVSDLLVHMGWTRREGDIVADHLVLSDQSGHPSHGTGMLGTYVASYQAGAIKPGVEPKDSVAKAPFLVVDANFSLGHVVALDTIDRATEIAREYGVCVANIVRAHHMGRIGHYAERAATANMISLFWANVYGRPPLVAPFGGTEARFGTNPHCVGIPRMRDRPILLDFATSRIALGKTRVAYTRGTQVAEGCLLDHAGNETSNPAVMFEEPLGALVPFGDHKGYGIAVIAELLSSVLAGGETIADLTDAGMIANNLFLIVFDPARLGRESEATSTQIDRYVNWIKKVRLADGIEEVMVAGDPEYTNRQRLGDDVELSKQGLSRLDAAARAVGFRPFSVQGDY